MEEFNKNKTFRKYNEIFFSLKRKREDFIRDIDYYAHLSDDEKVISWLCDESSHHIHKFLLQTKEYEKLFEQMLNGSIDRSKLRTDPIQKSHKSDLDHILGDFFINENKNLDKNFYNESVEKYHEWKECTKNGLLRKLDILMKRNIPKGYKLFLKVNRDALVGFDDETCIKWMRFAR